MRSGTLLAAFLAVAGCSSGPSGTPKATSSPAPVRILAFTRTAGFHHVVIPAAAAALANALAGRATLEVTDDPARFSGAGLRPYRAVVFLLTTGDVLDASQQAAFEEFIARGGGYAGVHSATDTEYAWAWYHELVGATFKTHPKVQRAKVRILDPAHPSMEGLPAPWSRVDEWYDFRASPRPRVHVLATVDETTYAGGKMGRDHPIAWCRSFAGGRSWYTAMGHGEESWRDALFLRHVAAGVMTAAGVTPASCG